MCFDRFIEMEKILREYLKRIKYIKTVNLYCMQIVMQLNYLNRECKTLFEQNTGISW